MRFSSMVIAGGGLKIISTVGCIKYLEEIDALKYIKNYVGSSAGSMLCLALALNYTFQEMIEFLAHNIYDKSVNSIDPMECLDILETFGLSSGKNIEIMMQRMIYKKLKQNDITFIELAKITGKNFVACVSNVSKHRSEYFCVDTKPNMSVVTAIKISCAVPILCQPFYIDDDLYLDGGIFNNFPLGYFKNNTLKDIIGINIVATVKKPTSFIEYLTFLTYNILEKANDHLCIDDHEKNIVALNLDECNWYSLADLSLNFPKDKWGQVVIEGYTRMKEKLRLRQKIEIKLDEEIYQQMPLEHHDHNDLH